MATRKIKTTKDVAVRNEQVPANQLPDYLRDMVKEDAGKGVSTAAEDNLVPLLYVLQTNSPQVNRRSPDYVEGAESGDLWLRSSGLPAVKGDVGIKFQPCSFDKCWVEWKPNRGGFVARHPFRPDDAVEKKQPKDNDPDFMAWVRPNGNIVVETKNHIGLVYLPDGKVMPYVLPLVSTGLTVSKAWMFLINNKTIEGMKGPAPSFSCFYRLKTKSVTNPKGTWMKLEITDDGWVTSVDDYQRGRALNTAIDSGEKVIDTPDEEQQQSSGASDSAAM